MFIQANLGNEFQGIFGKITWFSLRDMIVFIISDPIFAPTPKNLGTG